MVPSTHDAPCGTSIYFLSTWPNEAKNFNTIIAFKTTREQKLDQNDKCHMIKQFQDKVRCPITLSLLEKIKDNWEIAYTT